MAEMIRSLCERVGADAMMAHLGVFARHVKLSGTGPERESFRYLQDTLDGYGFRTRLILHDAYISLPAAARVETPDGAPRCITHSFSRPSPPGGLRGELVYVGAGRASDPAAQDVRGKIVLVEGLASPAPTARASVSGAIGQLHISPHEHLHEMCVSPVWGSPAPDDRAQLPATTICTISDADGAKLRARLQAGERFEVTLHAEVDTGWRRTPILEAALDAPGAPPDGPFLLFSGHHDTWYFGVMDNGAANATMLEVARVVAQQREQWKRGLRLCFWSGHSHGRYSGSAWYADQHWHELARRCVAHVNVDSTGAKGNTVLADTPASTELKALGAEAVRVQGGQEMTGLRMSRAGDASFWGVGVPSLFMGMGEQPLETGGNVAAAFLGSPGEVRKGAGFGWWWHTPEDTLDKIDPELLVRDTRIYLHAVWRLLADPVLPLDYAAFAEDLDSQIAALGDAMDLAELRDRVAALRRGAERLRSHPQAQDRAAGINQALMRMGRALVTIDYTRADRFDHDPALPLPPYPALEPLRALAAAPAGSDEAKFAAVAARRALNRVRFAVKEAIAAADGALR
jgi:hypothetical protein